MSQIQLVARGDIDASLTGNPSITFFKSVYRKHTNFSMEDMVVDTIPAPFAGHKYPLKILTGTGDLLYGTNYILRGNKVYCGNGIANISTAVIDNISIVINSREIDKTYGHYLEVYHELNQENPNSTITNLGRIEDSSLYHIAHNADLSVQTSHKSLINNNRSDTSYFDNALSKPTNIMGHGLGYPPTHFQKMSKCGGTYCSPSYLQNQHKDEMIDVNNPVIHDDPSTGTGEQSGYSANYNYVASINNRPESSGHVSGMNRHRFRAIITSQTRTTESQTGSFTYNMKIGFNQFVKDKRYKATKISIGETDITLFNHETTFVVESVDNNTINFRNFSTDSGNPLTVISDTGEYTAEFTMVDLQPRSAHLLNASQITESVNKGDILGDCTVPLNFWYCKSPGMAIPLCALHKSVDVEIYMQFASVSDADWTRENNTDISSNNQFITYDQNINNKNDIVNAYKIDNSNLKGILSTENKFNFSVDLAVTYIYLDNMERKRFAQSSHEYLIEQLQYQYENGQTNKDIDISSFQHPVKELIWTGQPYLSSNIVSINNRENTHINDLNNGTRAHSSGVRWVYGSTTDNCLYGGGINNEPNRSKAFGNISYIGTIEDSTGSLSANAVTPGTGVNASWAQIGDGKFVQGLLGPSTPDCLDYVTYKLKFNSTDRCQPRPLQYFTRENVYKYHKGGSISVPDSIAVYSFALNPTDSSPSGTCNFSNIDDIKIERGSCTFGNGGAKYKRVNVYAINYNILRFVNGQAGISYF